MSYSLVLFVIQADIIFREFWNGTFFRWIRILNELSLIQKMHSKAELLCDSVQHALITKGNLLYLNIPLAFSNSSRSALLSHEGS